MAGTSMTRKYVAIFFALVVMTIVTVSASYVDLGHGGNAALAVAIAATKATLVALFFMHLKYDERALFVVALFPLVLFAILLLALKPDVADHATPQPEVQSVEHEK